MEVVVKLLLSYLLGSVLGGAILGRLMGVDLRQGGSGNPGATNALRTQGKGFALGVLAIDAGKGYLASTVIPWLPWPNGDMDGAFLTVLCAMAAVLGHVYPVFAKFRGGKGAATLIGAAVAVIPSVFPVILVVWLIVLVLSGYVGLSTMAAAIAAPIYFLLLPALSLWTAEGLFALVAAVFVLYTHRVNISRMLQGEEHRFHSVMLLRRLRKG
jgi:glycerol-3-phosphate acyltransferase PlsY